MPSDDGLDCERIRIIADLFVSLNNVRNCTPGLRMDLEELARTALARSRNRIDWHAAAMPTVFRGPHDTRRLFL